MKTIPAGNWKTPIRAAKTQDTAVDPGRKQWRSWQNTQITGGRMQGTDDVNWMFSAALGALARADRMHQHFLKLLPREGLSEPSWEPPVDMLETETEVLILVALPGVAPDDVEAVIEDDALIVRGRRTLPEELRDAQIHRLELPQGRFERRIVLPPGRYSISSLSSHGCISLRLKKSS